MKEKIINAVKYILFLGVGIALMYYLFDDLKISEVLEEAKSMDFRFYALSGLFALTSHVARAIRWKYLIDALGYSTRTINVIGSVLQMYLFNILIPRSGEVVRCGSIYKTEKVPVKKSLGTVVIERFVDLISLLIITALLFVFRFDIVKGLYEGSTFPEKVATLAENKMLVFVLIVAALLPLLLVILFRNRLMKIKIFAKIFDLIGQAIDGLKKVGKLKQKWSFIGLTVLMWFMYFAMLYACFYAYEPTSVLGPSAGLAMFVAGSYGMVAPTNGGVGAWHAMALISLGVFGMNPEATEAQTFVNVTFVMITVTVAMFGVISLIFLPMFNRKKKVAA